MYAIRSYYAWEKNPGFDNVMLVARATDAVTGNPAQGTAYSAGNIIDGAEVIYKGTATGFIHSGLQNNTTYNYKLYTLNNNYYSDGISASAATDDSEGCTFDLSLGEDINVCVITSYSIHYTKLYEASRLPGIVENYNAQCFGRIRFYK